MSNWSARCRTVRHDGSPMPAMLAAADFDSRNARSLVTLGAFDVSTKRAGVGDGACAFLLLRPRPPSTRSTLTGPTASLCVGPVMDD